MKFTDPLEAVQSAVKYANQAQKPGVAQKVHAGATSANFTHAQLNAARRSGYDAGFSAGFAASREANGRVSNTADASTSQSILNIFNKHRAA